MTLVFNSEWRAKCDIRRVSIRRVAPFIRSHYLKKRPAFVLLCLEMFERGTGAKADLFDQSRSRPVGCIVYASPPTETETRYGGKTWELARLFILDDVPKNAETWLIAKSVKFIKANYPDVEFLVSYADPSAGHEGTIYKAANWKEDGKTDEGRASPRCDYLVGTKRYSRKKHMPEGAEYVLIPRVSKNRFLLSLRKSK